MKTFVRKKRVALIGALLCVLLCALLSVYINGFALAQTEPRRYCNVVALVNFSDTPAGDRFSADEPAVESLFNGDKTAGDESLQGYLLTLSRGAVSYESVLFPITLPQTESFYRQLNSATQLDLLTDALQQLHDPVRDAALDEVFSLTLYVNAVTLQQSDGFWPHQTTMPSEVTLADRFPLRQFIVLPTGMKNYQGGFLQVLCHETLHRLGADDLYHYSPNAGGDAAGNDAKFDKSYPVGVWDIMGNTLGYASPVSLNAYYRVKCGLLTAQQAYAETLGEEVVLAEPFAQSGTPALKFGSKQINGHSEYFLIEYRPLTGYDAFYANRLTPGYVLYRVREGVQTGNRVQKNGDEIVFAKRVDQPTDRYDYFSLADRDSEFDASFDAGDTVEGLTYSDGTLAEVRVSFTATGATVSEYADKQFTFLCGERKISDIAGKVSGGRAERTYYSDGDGIMHVLLTAGESVTFSAEGYAFSLAGYAYDPGQLQAETVALDALPRTVFFKVRSGEGEVSYTVNGGTPMTGALEDGMLVVKDVKNGDEIVLTVDGQALPAIVVSHRNASGIYEVSPPSDLVRLDAYWLAVPAVLFLIIAIFVVLHDYRRRR